MAENDVYVMTPVEIARGYLVGHEGVLPPASPDAPRDPRAALEAVIRTSLERPPCGIAFSGGRDSSAVLAVATHVARRDGLPEPVPVTKVFPGVPEAQEGEWQELVIRHLGLADWQRLHLTDELDLVGPLARPNLERHGVVWPPTIHGDIPMMKVVRGGSLLDGEGGDEVLGVAAHRIAGLTGFLHSPRPLRWPRVRSALGSMATRTVRRRHVQRQSVEEIPTPWLLPTIRSAFIGDHAEAQARLPFSFAASVRMVPQRRTQSLLARNRRLLSQPYDVEVRSPLLHPDFIHALAEDSGILGHADRTIALTALIGDLLPDRMLARTSKATFNGAFINHHTKSFTASWTGEGPNSELIDSKVLQGLWKNGEHNALMSAIIQFAWITDHQAVNL